MEGKRYIISGGGTGGHIFPALSIANEIKQRYANAQILFVGALGKMEMEKVPAAGYKIIGLPVSGFPRKPGIKWFKFAIDLFKSTVQARKIIKDFKPDIAIGVGGFASGPVLRAASKKGIPIVIQEQNSYAGITNKLLAKKAQKICVAYENMERFFPAERIILTGNPVRNNLIITSDQKAEALKYFNISTSSKVILIIGGSLGARSVNDAVINNLMEIEENGTEIIWQTGAFYFDEMVEKTQVHKPKNLQLHKFISRMDLAYTVADLIISRAGAGTISELCLVGKSTILVPSPNVAEDHQTKNAMALVEQEAAVLVNDNTIDKELLNQAFDLMNNDELTKKLALNIQKLAKPKATETIVNEIEDLIKI